MVQGELRTYGYRVASGMADANWVFFQEARVVNAVNHECNAALEDYVFKTIDGRGKLFARVNAALVGICQRYWAANALYGDTANDAFRVDTSFPGINTPQTVALGASTRRSASRPPAWRSGSCSTSSRSRWSGPSRKGADTMANPTREYTWQVSLNLNGTDEGHLGPEGRR